MKVLLMFSAIAILAPLAFGHSIFMPTYQQSNMAPHQQGMKHQHGQADCDEDHPAPPPPYGLKNSMHIPPYQHPSHHEVPSHPELPPHELPPPHGGNKPGHHPPANSSTVEPSNGTSTEPIEVYIPPLPTDNSSDNSSDHSISKRHVLGSSMGSMDLRKNSTDNQEPCNNDTVIFITERIRRTSGDDPKSKFSKVIGLVDIFKLQDCVSRVICDLNCNPDGYGDDGKKVLNMALQLQTGGAVSESDVRAYVNAGLTGRKFRQAGTCDMCASTFANCSAPTPDLIDVFSLIKLDV